MNIFALSGIMIAVTCVTEALLMFVKGKSKAQRLWGLLCLAVAVWGVGSYKVAVAVDPQIALRWWHIGYTGVIMIPIFLAHFTHIFLNLNNKWLIRSWYGLGTFFLVLNFKGELFIDQLRFVFNQFYYISPPARFYTAFVVMFFGLALYSIIQLGWAYFKEGGLKKNQLKYIVVALLVGFGGGAFSFLPVYHIDIYPYLNSAIALSAIIVAYAIIRYRLMDIRIATRAVFVYLGAATFAYGAFYALAGVYNRYFGGIFNSSSYAAGVIIAPFFAVIFYHLAGFLQFIANKYFFTSLYNYQETIAKLSRDLNYLNDLDKIVELIINTVKDTMQLDKAGVLQIKKTEKGTEYKVAGVVGFNPQNGINFVKDDFLMQYLEKTQKPLVREELNSLTGAGNEKMNFNKLRDGLTHLEAEIALPLVSGNKLIGAIVLGSKVSGDAYTKEDIELLDTLSSQAGIAIDNAQLYQEIRDFNKNLQQRVDEQTKNIQRLLEMKSEFLRVVNHQLRTPTSIIKGMLSMLVENPQYDGEKQKETLNKIYLSADRLETILDDILNAQDLVGAKPTPNLKPVHMEVLINKVIANLTALSKQKNIFLVFEKPVQALPLILLDELLIDRALKKLIDNAILYTDIGGVTVQALLIKENQKEFIQITIQDTGIGIIEESKPHLFNIFSRGKEAEQKHPNGSGLGLYIVKEYIEAHRGRVEIMSEGKDKGTTAVITLPVITEV